MSKKVLISIITILCVFLMALTAQAATTSVVVDGTPLAMDVPPVVENQRLLVPMRAIFESLGASVSWDDNNQLVTATKGDITIKLTIGGKAYKNDAEVELDVPAKTVDGRTLVPLRFIGESLGAEVYWDDNTGTVYIKSQAPTAIGQDNQQQNTETDDNISQKQTEAENGTPENEINDKEKAQESGETSEIKETAETEKPEAVTPFEEYLNTLPFDASVIADVDKEAQFNITGKNAGNYVIIFKDGKVTWKKGTSENPAITVTTTEETWLNAANRIIDPTAAIMNGLIKADGDLPFFVEIKDAFIKKAASF